jgi:type VI secretion system protein ImpE
MLMGELMERHGGDLSAVLSDVQGQIRAKPGDPGLRVYLFQLFCVMGDWGRAAKQLEAMSSLSQEHSRFARVYSPAVASELLRREVFFGARSPMLFGEPEQWEALLLQALRQYAEGHCQAAARLTAQAFEMAPAQTGTINGAPFTWLADADQRLGPVLEVVTNGGYYWMPFNRIKTLVIDKPQDLRDMVWAPAQLVLRNGTELGVLLPARYPTKEAPAESDVMLARKTVWNDAGDGVFFGVGQKVLATDVEERAILDVRRIDFDVY